jgi:hypothetical protein
MVTKREMIRAVELVSNRLRDEGKQEAHEEFQAFLGRLSRSTLDDIIKQEGGGCAADWLRGKPYG